MKTNIGGDRLGSGNKEVVNTKTFNRSTHDLSYLWRSSMSSGTLVPFMNIPALPGDSFDIDLNCEVITLPTVGPLFGSFKVQLDVFQIPIRLYNAQLHMNQLGIGMDMSKVKLPKFELKATIHDDKRNFTDNAQTNPSSLVRYLGVAGAGNIDAEGAEDVHREFNAVPLLAYWDIYKNYYANKQEEVGYAVHTTAASILQGQGILSARMLTNVSNPKDVFNTEQDIIDWSKTHLVIEYGADAEKPEMQSVHITLDGQAHPVPEVFETPYWDDNEKALYLFNTLGRIPTPQKLVVNTQFSIPEDFVVSGKPYLQKFPLKTIDEMRREILQHSLESTFVVNDANKPPYNFLDSKVIINDTREYSTVFSQEMLGIKTYQSDLFNNWISTEWIDGDNGVNAITAVDTSEGNFTIDALNLANKVYNMLNRIAISGGTYDDWLDAAYTHERSKSVESPVYMGSLIKELAFEEVISNSQSSVDGVEQPLGTLGGRGRLTQKNKGGKIKVKVDEPSYIIGIVSLTPRVDYSQGNDWHMNLDNMDDLHKPDLDAIGFQDLIVEQMAWQTTKMVYETGEITQLSAGKQPAWINYMTAVNKTYGNFAEKNKDMFMTLNRRYDIDEENGNIKDLTTYIDPSKFNHIFAQTSLDAQNFWVQISNNITARRKMSAKVIPNL